MRTISIVTKKSSVILFCYSVVIGLFQVAHVN